MIIHLFVKGIIIGLAVAAPIGPNGVLTIQRSISGGRLSGTVSGLGAATIHAGYGCIAGFGLTAIASFFTAYHVWIQLIGGLFLCYLGVRIFLAEPADVKGKKGKEGLLKVYFATFTLAITNPVTILSFMAIFAGLGIGTTHGGYNDAGFLVVGVFTGSMSWWLLLSNGVASFRHLIRKNFFKWINYISGSIMGIFGIIALLSLI